MYKIWEGIKKFFKRKPKFVVNKMRFENGILQEYYYKGRVTAAVYIPIRNPVSIEYFPSKVDVMLDMITSYFSLKREEELKKSSAFEACIKHIASILHDTKNVSRKVEAIKVYRDFYQSYNITKTLRESKDFVEAMM